MKTTRDSRSNQPQASASDKKNSDIDLASAMELLKQAQTLLGPMLEFHKADKEMTMDDIKIRWDVRVVRGQSTSFAHLEGGSTFHNMLAPTMYLDAPQRIEHEITDKIIQPLVGIFQQEVQRRVEEIMEADDAARKLDDRSDDDLL